MTNLGKWADTSREIIKWRFTEHGGNKLETSYKDAETQVIICTYLHEEAIRVEVGNDCLDHILQRSILRPA